jgi:hypothetical protein
VREPVPVRLHPAISLEVTEDPLGSPGVIGLRYASKTMDASPRSIDYGIAIVHRFLTLINGDAPYGLRSVQLPHARLAPESAYPGASERRSGLLVRVRFSASRADCLDAGQRRQRPAS